MNLKNASVIGFFSLPSASLAEHNPSAYNAAMADAPEGAGTCAHCGTGIRHHVIVRCDGVTAFIGTDCAARIGGEVSRCASAKLTSEQIAERDAKNAELMAKYHAEQEAARDILKTRALQFEDVLRALASQGSEFHRSLAEQLKRGDLSHRQADFVCKAVFGPRQNKRNRDAWNSLADKLEGVEVLA